MAASAFARWAFLLYAVFDAGRAESVETGRTEEVLGESFENVGFSLGRVRPSARGRLPDVGREEERSSPLLYGRVLVLLSLRSSENLRTGRSLVLLSLRSSENLRTGRSLENFRSLRSPEEESCPKSLRPVGLAKPVGRLPAGGLPVARPDDGLPDDGLPEDGLPPDGLPEDDAPKVFPAEYGRFGARAEAPSEESLLWERFHAPSGRGDDEKRLPVLELEPERELEAEYVPDDDGRGPERGAPDDDEVERAPAREFPAPELKRELEPERVPEAERGPERGAPDGDDDEGERAPAREFPVPELGRELEPGRGLKPERGLDAERPPEREAPDDDDEVERAPAREFPELEPERGLEAERVLPPDDEPLLGADLGRVGRGIMLAFDEKRVLLRGRF